ncbi:MAG: LPS-assembly protein LptD [Rhodospirillales bacterium]|nr:LPS-assembly protein LptD [Rhodospirillales bacterium]
MNDTWRWGADLQRSTDDTYLRRYSLGSQKSLNTRLYAEAFQNRDYAIADSYLFQGLQESDDPGSTPIILPSLEFSHVGEPNSNGVNTTFDASFLAITRTDGFDTRRLSLKGGINRPYFGPAGNVLNFSATLRGDLYHVTSLPLDSGSGTNTGFEGRIYPQLKAQWRLPVSKRHGPNVTEMVEPTVAIQISPNSGNSSSIPNEDSIEQEFDDTNVFAESRFTGLDRVEGGTQIGYGVKWGVFGSKGGSSSFFVGQRYRFRTDDSFADGSGLEDKFSDIVARVRVKPGKNIQLAYKTRLSKENLSPNRTEVSIAAGPPALNFSTEYAFFDRTEGSEFGGREEISGTASAKLNRYWRSNFSTRYNLEDDGDLRSLGLALIYECDCFKFDISLQRTFFEDRDVRPSDSIIFRLSFKTLCDVQTGISKSGS